VEGTLERDHTLASCRDTRDLDCILDRLSTGREKERFRILNGRQLVQTFGQCHISLVSADLERGMREQVALRFRGGHDFRVTVAGVAHRDADCKVDIAFAIGIPKFRVFCSGGENWCGRVDPARHRVFPACEQFSIRCHRSISISPA